MPNMMDRKSFIQHVLDITEIRSELLNRVKNEKEEEIKSKLNRIVLNESYKTQVEIACFILFLMNKKESSIYLKLLLAISILYTLVMEIRIFQVERINRDIYREIKKIRNNMLNPNALLNEKNITNQILFSTLEKLTGGANNSASCSNDFICTISAYVMTNPVYIEKKVGDVWIKLDGHFEKALLLEWFKKSSNKIPQLQETYSESAHRVVEDPFLAERILAFMKKRVFDLGCLSFQELCIPPLRM